MSKRFSPQLMAEMRMAAAMFLPRIVKASTFLAGFFVVMSLINVGLVIALALRVVTPVAVSENGVAIQLKPLDKIEPRARTGA